MNENILDHPQDFRKPLTPQEAAKRRELEIDLKEAEKRLKNARIALWIFVGLQTIALIVLVARESDLSTIIAQAVIILLFIFAAVYSHSYPLASFASVFTLYILLLILAGINQPSTLLQGLIIKVIILGYLGMGAFYGKEKRDILRKLKQYGD
ncbi:MAG: hypothetical protein SFU99_12555 [Saprospiraceae bacterium]|nr:hypothetical protein [Saprospiraceae bacterium]